MSPEELISKHLIVHDDYEYDMLVQIVSQMMHDIGSIYAAVKSGSKVKVSQKKLGEGGASDCIRDFASRIDESNTSGILLFLTKLPVIAREIVDFYCNDRGNGYTHIELENRTMSYLKDLFMAGYDEVIKLGEKQLLINLYIECEKFIDALVVELKSDISPMIDFKKPTRDDLMYLRRLLKNIINCNEQTRKNECAECAKDDCLYCNVQALKAGLDKNTKSNELLIDILEKKLKGETITEEMFATIPSSEYKKHVKHFVSAELSGGHKKIVFMGQPENFSCISAERFGKILKKRYNDLGYASDRDIYYMLANGIDAQSVFFGDDLMKNIHLLYEAYTGQETEKAGE